MTPITGRLDRILIVGGGLAGARTCEQLRRQGHEGGITLLSAEPHPPYDRPPLSKEVLRGGRDDTTLPVDFGGLGVHLACGTAATGLDLANRVVHTATAGAPGRIGFDGLVIATGATPVTLPGPGPQFALRTLDDALRLRTRLTPGARVVIVGAGWIGAEVATSALARGCTVTCVEAGPAPLVRALGAEVGKRLAPWWAEADLRLDTAVDRVEDGAVVLADGTELLADVVVAGVGARPETRWLTASGLELDRGVVVDEWLRAAVPGVVAVGDAAAWWSRRYGTRMRVEHWDDAAAGPAVAARSLLAARDTGSDGGTGSGSGAVHDPVPYFWSDQFGHKVRYVGHHDPAGSPVWREPADGRGWSAAWLDTQGRLTAVLTVDRPRELPAARRALAAGAAPDPSRLADPSVPLTHA